MEFNATIIVALINFVIFIIIMNWILYKPIGNIVQKRQKLIDDNYAEAKENSNKSKAILQERTDKLTAAHKQNQQNYLNKVSDAKNKRNESIRIAKEESANNIKEKTDIFDEESKQAKEVLKKDVVELAKMISSKFVKSQEAAEIDSELIDKVLQG